MGFWGYLVCVSLIGMVGQVVMRLIKNRHATKLLQAKMERQRLEASVERNRLLEKMLDRLEEAEVAIEGQQFNQELLTHAEEVVDELRLAVGDEVRRDD